jgi:hypothetical protein
MPGDNGAKELEKFLDGFFVASYFFCRNSSNDTTTQHGKHSKNFQLQRHALAQELIMLSALPLMMPKPTHNIIKKGSGHTIILPEVSAINRPHVMMIAVLQHAPHVVVLVVLPRELLAGMINLPAASMVDKNYWTLQSGRNRG